MVKYKIDEDRIIYNNQEINYPFALNDVYRAIVPIKEQCVVRYIDLYFSNQHLNPAGNISIEVYYDSKYTSYNVNIKDIPLSAPLRLSFEREIEIKETITLVIKPTYKNNDRLFMWINQIGLCMRVCGHVSKVFNFKKDPTISIITPLYKTNIEYLKQTISSVEEQYYPKWELCLVDDGSGSKKLRDYLKTLDDKRIKVKINKKNRGISLATNEAISMASGEYVCFLDHDDLLSKEALQEVALVINEDPKTDLIYTDEDKVNEQGSYGSPFFKPDWNYSLLLSHMYTCHLSIYRKKIIDKIGGIRKGFEGSQDYDLALRFIEKTQRIRHIPKILYHWRITKDSTSSSIRNKPDARINAVRALDEHLKRIGREGCVSAGPFQGHYHIEYPFAEKPIVSIIIPFKDQVHYLKNLLYTISHTRYPEYEIVLVDNNSEERATKDFLNSLSEKYNIRILSYKRPFNFSAINNYAAKKCSSELLLFLNNDMEVADPDWLLQLTQQFIRPDVAAVGAKLLYLDHRIQHAGIFVGVNGIAGHGHKRMWDWQPGYYGRPHMVQEITAVTGACMMVRKKDFDEVGGFEEKLPKAFNDIDFCLKLRSNYRLIVYTPYAKLFHHESISRGYDNLKDKKFQEAIKYMDEKWGCLNYRDPYYNPNLTRKREDFSYLPMP